ncbi:MAG: polysaccharide biosynthesis/export family protein [Phenylobacterium sp.]|uniref:polysaccharide biosynthesis/export family protein n=1 Tax=Phenylobacterium sp. TaxID=1871053 RepID=UPI00273329C1|nr:polysaccharide biosynthesis/export family protein [Phenylobacterium sp.]MDP3173313.1 polysaccharide biosynthesis/export family protein [Phenylobacterium sp.]
MIGTAVAAASLSLAACESGAPRGSVTSLPPPDPAASAAVQQQDYRIGPLDTLEITVFKVDNLNRTLQVDASGAIDFPLIGSVQASAKTPRQLGDEIAVRLGARYLQSPQVGVLVKSSQSSKFTVEGSVKRPGVYDIIGRMTLIQAVATAEGVDQFANLKTVVIFRTVDRQRRAAVVNLADIRLGKVEDPQIYPADVIVVPVSGSKRALQNVIGATPLFSLLRLGM